jgi:hypothetical protein
LSPNRKRHHRRNLDNTHLPLKVKQSLRKRQKFCECLTALSLAAALLLIIAAPLLLIPILSDFQNQALTFTVYLCACCVGAAVCILAAACFGNFYWYFDRRRGHISWFLHCGTGPFDYYWGKAFSKETPDSAPRTIHGVYLRASQRSQALSVIQVQPGNTYAIGTPRSGDQTHLKVLSTGGYPTVLEHAAMATDVVDAIQEEDEEDEASDCESSAASDSIRSEDRPLDKPLPTSGVGGTRKPIESDSEVKVIISRNETSSPVYEEPLPLSTKRMMTPPID